MAEDPDPIQESLRHAERESSPRFLLGCLLPLIVLIIVIGVTVAIILRHTPQPMP